MPPARPLPRRSRERAFLLLLQRPLEERQRRSLASALRLRLRLRWPLRHELCPREQRALRIGSLRVTIAVGNSAGGGFRSDRLGRSPLRIDEQRLGLGRDLPACSNTDSTEPASSSPATIFLASASIRSSPSSP